MTHLIKTLIFLASAPFADATSKLSHPQFQERQAASRTMKEWLPASGVALICVLENTDSPEAYERAERLLSPLAEFRRAIRIDAEINALIRRPDEIDSLPFMRPEAYEHLAHNEYSLLAMQSVVRRMKRDGHFSGLTFYAEPTPGPDTYMGDCHWLSGMNAIRFAVRGLPCPQTSKVPLEVIREKWLAIKSSR